MHKTQTALDILTPHSILHRKSKDFETDSLITKNHGSYNDNNQSRVRMWYGNQDNRVE